MLTRIQIGALLQEQHPLEAIEVEPDQGMLKQAKLNVFTLMQSETPLLLPERWAQGPSDAGKADKFLCNVVQRLAGEWDGELQLEVNGREAQRQGGRILVEQ